MKTAWDYSELAVAYLKRPDYAPEAVAKILQRSKVNEGDKVCDVGAGVAHLTLHLAKAGLSVTAVEPNDQMRALGTERTAAFANVTWVEGTGERTGQAENQFRLVTFGSSFNVTDRTAALKETARILVKDGWFACLWNHRVLEDPIQSTIQRIIEERVAGFDHGTRREDQTAIIDESGLFETVERVEGHVVHQQKVEDCVAAWRSHATLQRQAGDSFAEVVAAIEQYLAGLGTDSIEVPYVTNVWLAKRNS